MLNNLERARQFLPFDALKGFRESLEKTELLFESKKILSDDSEEELNKVFLSLDVGNRVLVKYYYGFEYIETYGIIKKIDSIYKNLYLSNSKISFDDIIEIKKI